MANEEVPWLTVRRRTYAEAFQPPAPLSSNVVADTILFRAPSHENSETEDELNNKFAPSDDFLGVEEDLKRIYANAKNIAPIKDEEEEDEKKEDVQEKQDDIQTMIDVLKEEFQQGDESFDRNFHEITFRDKSIMNRANECFSVTVDKGNQTIYVDSLKFSETNSKNCKKRGYELLNGLKKAANRIGYRLKIGQDESFFPLGDNEGNSHIINLAGYELLTKGQSYYNQQGFYQSDFPEHNLHNQILREEPVKDVFKDFELSAWKDKAKYSNLAKRVLEEMQSRPRQKPFKLRDLGSMIKDYVKNEKEKVSKKDIGFIQLVVSQSKPYFHYYKYNLVYNHK